MDKNAGRLLGLSLLFLAAGICLGAVPAWGGAGVTYHGRLIRPDGQPVDSSNVQFKIQIRTPELASCLMYEEIQTRDLSASKGVFSLTIGQGASTPNVEPFTLEQVFSNTGKTLTFLPGKCSGTSTVTLNPTDGRQIFVSFTDGSFSGWEPLPSENINLVPSAFEAVTLGGVRSSQLFRVENGAGVPQAMAPWSVSAYSVLTGLVGSATVSGGAVTGISGTASGFTGSLAGDVTGSQGATRVEALQGRSVGNLSPSNGQVLTWNQTSTRWEPANLPASGGGGSVSSVDLTVPSYMSTSGGPITGSGSIALSFGSQTQNLVFASPVTGAGAPSFRAIEIRDLQSKFSGAFLTASGACTTGETLTYLSASDTLSCQPYSISSAQVTSALGFTPVSAASSLSGDVSGALGATSVDAIKGKTVAPGAYSAGQVLRYNGSSWVNALVDLSTDASGTLPIARGGTGAVSQAAAINNLLPAQGAHAGKILQTDGSNVSWANAPASGVTSINGATGASQTFQTSQNNTAPTFTRVGDTHTLEIPQASTSGVTAGTISYTDYQNFSGKQNALGFTPLNPANNLSELTASTARANLGLGTAATKNFGSAGGDLVQLDGAGKIPTSLLPAQSGTYFAQNGNAFGAPAVLGTTDAQPLHFRTGTSNKMTILTDGSVGIGVTPLRKFHVKADGSYQMRLENASTGGGFWNIGQADNAFGTGGGKLLFVPNSDLSTDATVAFTNSGRVGIGTSSPGAQLDVAGALRLTTTTMDTYTTPAGASVPTKINIPYFDPGLYGQIVSMGIPSVTDDTSRVLSLFDQRSVAHAPTLAVFSPNENKMIGFSWDGSNTVGAVKSTADLALQADGNILILPTLGNDVYMGDTIMGGVDYGAMFNFTTSSRVADGLALTIKGDLGAANRSSVYIEAADNGSDRYLLRAVGNGGAAEALAVATNGSVGIGKLNPQVKLDVAGTIRANEICDEVGGNCKDLSSGWGAGGDIDGIVTNSGSGLSGGAASGTATLSLVTDGSTVEVNGSNQLQVKDSGITSAKITNGTILGADMDFTGVQTATSGLVMKDSAGKFSSIACATAGHVPAWTATGFVCQAPSITEADPKVGANTTNMLSKWSGTALVASGIYEDGSGNVGIGTTGPSQKLHVVGTSGTTLRIVDGNEGSGKVLTSDANGVASWQNAAAGGLTNFTESVNASSPNGTVPVVSLTAVNAATDVDIALRSKGSGALTRNIPDGTMTGGNKRGISAVDWQANRILATQVASGTSSSITGGYKNTASGDFSVVAGGSTNTASNMYAMVGGGATNTASGQHTFVGGGDTNTASGQYSVVLGGGNNTTTGQGSLATGFYTTAASRAQVTIGQYNMPKGGENSSAWVATDPLFVVGNGSGPGASRANALTILKNGNVGIGTLNPGQVLDVVGNVRTTGQLTTGSSTLTGGTNAIDWNQGNSIATDYNCGSPIDFANLADGGTYSLVVNDGGTTQCSFSTTITGTGAGTVQYKFKPANTTRAPASYTVYTFMRVGTIVLVSWSSGFQ